ncbi:hypothetical protein [Usitatibacter palustris]|uniref:Uncharacterized protein n=1 Tax=Usitatibacter palustris TaxID=2732487 RepID=A0A6M4H1W6_9PROT|nr:hypothetical protein [Usitatibacter palustris]QJR13509.1 hypothetical protein DSM104440_00293 [Usitatibacter palustris]
MKHKQVSVVDARITQCVERLEYSLVCGVPLEEADVLLGRSKGEQTLNSWATVRERIIGFAIGGRDHATQAIDFKLAVDDMAPQVCE